MTDQPQQPDPQYQRRIQKLTTWVNLLGVLFRILIIVSLVAFSAIFVLLLVTSLLQIWFLLLPIALLALGIILARLEYLLYNRAYDLKTHLPSKSNATDQD